MTTCRTKYTYLSIFLLPLLAQTLYAQTPAPAVNQPFPLPLTDNTQATAAFLPTHDGDAYLTYATTNGKLGLYQLTPTTTNPTPQPPPTPPTPPEPPTPPTPPKPTTINLIVVGNAQPPAINATITTYLTQHSDTIATYSVAMVSDPTPNAAALHWIGLTAGNAYPYAFIATSTNAILWQGPVPADPAALLTIIDQQTGRKQPACKCPNGICPAQPQTAPIFQPLFRSRGR